MQVSSYRNMLVAVLLAATNAAQADEWGGKIGLGAIATSGNSETSTVQAEFGLDHKRDAWSNELRANAVQARSESVDETTGESRTKTTTERYFVGLRTAYDFTDTDFIFLQLDFEKDLFGGIRERTVQTLGYGRRLLHSASHMLDLELGAGARQLKPQADGARRQSNVIGRLGLDYKWTLSETSKLGQTLTVEGGEDNVYTEAVSSLKLAVIGGVFANIGFTVKNNSEVPVGTEKTDTISSVSLAYEF